MTVCLGRSTLESVEKTSALSKYGKDCDGDILGLQDRATKAVIIVPWAAVAHFFALKSSLSTNCMSALPKMKDFPSLDVGFSDEKAFCKRGALR